MRHNPILRLAVPSIVSNITVPLLGIVDLAIVGHIGDARMIGAIAVGGMMFNLIYWVFGFLRMGTSGLTAQAFGRDDRAEQRLLLYRSITIGLYIALLMLVFQVPLFSLAMFTVGASSDVVSLVHTYYNICVWGAPAVLVSSGLMGWFIGMQNTRVPMMIAILQNMVNILLSLLFVFGFHMQLRGVAFGTLVAQYVGLIVALWFLPRDIIPSSWREVFRLGGWLRLLMLNFDIFLRTLCLVAVNLFFLSMGARSGTEILAVNTLLMEFYILFSFILDGFAFAGEALCGRYWGARDMTQFRTTVRRLFGWGLLMTLLFTLTYIVGSQTLVSLLTSDEAVVSLSSEYVIWTWFIPLAGVAAFVWDGVFIGITATRSMLLSALLSAGVFFATDIILHPHLGNHALWIAFLLFLAMRGLVQTALYFHPRFLRSY